MKWTGLIPPLSQFWSVGHGFDSPALEQIRIKSERLRKVTVGKTFIYEISFQRERFQAATGMFGTLGMLGIC